MRIREYDGDLPDDLVAQLASASRIAVDTETSGLDWRTSELELCQIYSPPTGVLLVRNVTDVPLNLGTVLADEHVVKVFHFAPFDLRFLEARWRVAVRAVACTKAAAKILEPGLQRPAYSLMELLNRHCGVKISKGPVRTSDWGAEHLTTAQKEYAAGDVQYLLELDAVLQQSLKDVGRLDLLKRVCDYMPLDSYLDVNGFSDPLTY